MWVTHLSLANFRNYSHAELSFARGANLLLGTNGQGKTNVAEAIAYFASLSSHRTSIDSALIKADAEAAIARMQVHRLDREVLLELQINRSAPNKAQLNRSSIKPAELPNYFSSVVFAPEDLQIVRGDPAIRRRFLDETVIALNPVLRQLFADYERVVKQRTALLKSARALRLNKANDASQALATLDVWNERLIQLGSRIIHEREKLICALSEPLGKAYFSLIQDDHLPSIELLSSVGGAADMPAGSVPRETSQIEVLFRDALKSAENEERERALTLVGPHRDELVLRLNNLPVKGYASHGETWSFILALRLATAQLIRLQSSAGDPVLILDDVFAELDSKRRNRLFTAIEDFDQVIVTAAVAEDVPDTVRWNTIHIHAGQVVPDEPSGTMP